MRTSRSAAIATACAVVVALLTATPATADAVRWSHLDGRDSGKLASGLSSSVAESNLKRTGDLTPESWWGNDSSWNRYAYVVNNPIAIIDPDGRDLHIVFDFRDSGISPAQQSAITFGAQQRYINAGVKNVNVYSKGEGKGPSLWTKIKGTFNIGKTRVVYQKFVDMKAADPRDDSAVYGQNENPFGASDNSSVYSGWASGEDSDSTNFLVNVSSHETGHSLLYPNHALDMGKPEPGSVMQPGVSQDELGKGTREFDNADAAALRGRLNEDED